MKRNKFLLIIFCLLIKINIRAQNVKGFYVNGFNNILGNVIKEDSLLLFAKNNGFNYLTLYDVHLVHAATPLTSTVTAQNFANFIQKAKTQYSITEIGVAAENFTFFNTVINVYNQQHPQVNQKVDVYNFEFEFWIPSSVAAGSYYCNTYLQPAGYTCDTAGAFAFYKRTLKRIDSLANLNGLKSEAYFGFFNTGQGKQVVQSGVDRVLVSIYITSANYSSTYQYNYAKPRLINLASANSNIKIITLYSSEPSFMQTWVNTNPYFLPYTDFTNSLTTEPAAWKNFIQDEGIQWFAYSFMPKKNMATVIKSNAVEVERLNIYPNPAKDMIRIKTLSSFIGGKTELIDYTGKTLYQTDITSEETALKPDLRSGIYFLRLISKENETITRKVIIE